MLLEGWMDGKGLVTLFWFSCRRNRLGDKQEGEKEEDRDEVRNEWGEDELQGEEGNKDEDRNDEEEEEKN